MRILLGQECNYGKKCIYISGERSNGFQLTHFVYICKVINRNFELRQDGWLKGKIKSDFKLPGLEWYLA